MQEPIERQLKKKSNTLAVFTAHLILPLILIGCGGGGSSPGAENGDSQQEEQGEETLSADSQLQSLSFSEGLLSPSFDPEVKNYDLNLAFLNSSNPSISAQASDGSAQLALNGGNSMIGELSDEVDASAGSGSWNIVVTADNGSTSTYTIAFVKESVDDFSQQAYIKASNPGEGDYFGYSVAIDGDIMVVGASLERSDTTGVNPTPNDEVNEAGAAYVFVRNGETWTQQAFLKASNAGDGDYFGISVDISGETIVVGAYLEDSDTTGVNSTPNEEAGAAGAAYVFTRNEGVWSEQAYIKASNAGAGDLFGYSVAVDGDTMVVGAYRERSSSSGVNSTPNDSVSGVGAAYVFTRNEGIWSEQAYLKASNPGSGDSFGYSVDVSGDIVVVGAHFENSSSSGVNSTPDNNASGSGAAYIYVRTDGEWADPVYLKASNAGVNDYFGASVAVDGDTLVVGAYGEDGTGTGVNSMPNDNSGSSGAAYVFVLNGGVWSEEAYLKASNTGSTDNFGLSVAIDGDTILVGADRESSDTSGINPVSNDESLYSGGAYLFTRDAGNWSLPAFLKASNTGEGDRFGQSVALSKDTLVVGAYAEDSSNDGINGTSDDEADDAGAVYVFR